MMKSSGLSHPCAVLNFKNVWFDYQQINKLILIFLDDTDGLIVKLQRCFHSVLSEQVTSLQRYQL